MSMISRLMGVMPFGIGLTVLFFIWTGEIAEDAPLFFKVIGSFVALGFISFGVAFFAGPSLYKNHGQNPLNQARDMAESLEEQQKSPSDDAPPQVSYSCPNCGSDIGEKAEVSPSGDVKCEYCKRWFNIHS